MRGAPVVRDDSSFTSRQAHKPSFMTLRALSLERKLPLLMTAVLVVVLAVSLFLTYGTLTRSAETAARDRLTRAARQVAGTVQAATQERLVQLRTVARASAILLGLRGTTVDN